MDTLDPTSIKRPIFIEELSQLIGKAETTIRTCATNRKYQHLIPRPRKMPNSRRLFWYEEEVLAWMTAATPVGPVIKRRRGRPTKAETLMKQREQAQALSSPRSDIQQANLVAKLDAQRYTR